MLGFLNILKGLSLSVTLFKNDFVDCNLKLSGGMLMNSILLLSTGFLVGSGYFGVVFHLKQDSISKVASKSFNIRIWPEAKASLPHQLLDL